MAEEATAEVEAVEVAGEADNLKQFRENAPQDWGAF
jgi:hypothetical protein